MYLKSQSGGASLVTVGFISLFILILTVSISRLMIGELHHALDLENNIQAYYQAEGGGEEAILALRKLIASDPTQLLTTPNQNCDRTGATGLANADGVLDNFGTGGGPFDHNPNITCRRVRTSAKVVNSNLKIDETAHFDLTTKGFREIEIEWDSANIPEGEGSYPFASGNLEGDPPYLEVTRIQYPRTASPTSISPSDVLLTSLYLVPSTSLSDCGGPLTLNFNCRGDAGGLVNVKCKTTSPYRCKATIINFMPTDLSKRTVLRLRPYFGAVKYTMKIRDSFGNLVDVVLDKTIIDVTAKVGGSYRRIEQEVSLVPRASDGLEAVFGDDSVCKTFNINDTGSGEYLDPTSVLSFCPLN